MKDVENEAMIFLILYT